MLFDIDQSGKFGAHFFIQFSDLRDVNAAVTYGNAKKADVVAVEGGSACAIEVKTTQEARWVIGGTAPEPGNSIWVLVTTRRSRAI